MLFRKYLLALLPLALASACGQPSTSQLQGHYEESNANSMDEFDGVQRAAAEYEPSRGVVIASSLLSYHQKYKMAADILASGVDKLWITVPSDYWGDLNNPEFEGLRKLVGSDMSKVELVRQKVPGDITVWARDWSPLGAKTDSGELHLVDFNYYYERAADDSTARSMISLLPVKRVSVPVYNEGGNFMNNTKGLCLMTTRVTDANEEASRSDDMILNAAQIKDYYGRFAGCKKTVIFPRIPYEGTGHIDMWAKFMNDDTVIVSELRDEVVNLPGYTATQRAKVVNLQNYLNARAQEVKALGLNVVRIPMPAPVFGRDEIFRSYTNSLIVNGVALVPRYVTPGNAAAYNDQHLLAGYEKVVMDTYRSLGYTFKWVNSDDLIAIGGAVHCTTMQIAR